MSVPMCNVSTDGKKFWILNWLKAHGYILYHSDERIGRTSHEAGPGAWSQELELYRKEFAGSYREAMPITLAQSPEPRN